MSLDFCSEAMIMDGDDLVIRGSREAVTKDFEIIKNQYALQGKDISNLTLVYPRESGLSDFDINFLVHHILENPGDGVCNIFRVALKTNNRNSLNFLKNLLSRFKTELTEEISLFD